MIYETYTANDGVKRSVEGKIFDSEFRVYRVYGDITNRQAIHEIALQISDKHGCDKVTFKF